MKLAIHVHFILPWICRDLCASIHPPRTGLQTKESILLHLQRPNLERDGFTDKLAVSEKCESKRRKCFSTNLVTSERSVDEGINILSQQHNWFKNILHKTYILFIPFSKVQKLNCIYNTVGGQGYATNSQPYLTHRNQRNGPLGRLVVDGRIIYGSQRHGMWWCKLDSTCSKWGSMTGLLWT